MKKKNSRYQDFLWLNNFIDASRIKGILQPVQGFANYLELIANAPVTFYRHM